jgi:SOS regulatory protein LexA
VSSEANASEPFEWRKSLNNARSALETGDAGARAKLVTALADAARMAELCHDKLFDMDPGKIADRTLEEWKDFLKILYNDVFKVYMKHIDLAPSRAEGALLTRFETIRDVALKASSGLKYMDAGESEQEGREAEVVKLRDLMIQLRAAVTELQPAWRIQEAVEMAELVYVPRVGRIAAGIPNLAVHSIESYLPLPRELVGNGNNFYLLEVSGDSMIEAGISEGDLVVVHEQPEANSGEIVVAMIDGEATIKTFKFSDGKAWLVPHNPAFTSTPCDESTTIIGQVVAVLRAGSDSTYTQLPRQPPD